MKIVVLVRAVNVGTRALRMEALRTVLAEVGGTEISTVGASGNAVVKVPGSFHADRLESRLEEALARTAGLETCVFARDSRAWASIVKGNPFPKDAKDDPAHLVVTVLKSRPSPEAWPRLASAIVGRERTAPGDRCAYVVYPDGIGRSELTLGVIERSLGVRGTARNWNTVLTLRELSSG